MMRKLFSLLALAAIGIMTATALAATSYCDVHAQCPDGSSGIAGKICYVSDGAGGKLEGVFVIDEPSTSTDNHCVLNSSKCPNPSRDCNQIQQWDAEWYKISCDIGDRTVPVKWCLSKVFAKRAQNIDCNKQICDKTKAVPTPIPYPDDPTDAVPVSP